MYAWSLVHKIPVFIRGKNVERQFFTLTSPLTTSLRCKFFGGWKVTWEGRR
jgi:hypothetical protein